MRRLVLLLVPLALLGRPEPAAAHHTTATNRAGGGTTAGLGADLEPQPLPRVGARLAHELVVFARRIEGTTRLDTPDVVLINTLTPTVDVALATGTRAQLRLPFGLLWTRPEGEDGVTALGLGDLSLAFSQDILHLFGHPSPRRFLLRASADLTAPTGRYDEEPALSITDVVGGTGGAIDLVTYDTRASLGAGSWAAGLRLGFAWQPHDQVVLSAALATTAPLTRTSDDIRWGVDLVSQVGLTYSPLRERLALQVGLDHRHHTTDSVPGVDEATGQAVRSDVGGRDELGASLGVTVRIAARLRCSLRAHVPVWQRAGGVQLVETVSTQLGCGYSWAL